MAGADIKAKFSEAGIVPNIVPIHPKETLLVQFHGKKETTPGEYLHYLDIKNAPRIEYKTVTDGFYYTLIMIDPDYPKSQSPTDAEYVHWLIPNIPADSFRIGTPTGSRPVLGYSPPNPMVDSGDHRFVILLYDQGKRKISVPTMKKRANFKIKAFIDQHKLGEPLAGNYFTSRHD